MNGRAPAGPVVSAVICTHNRAALLPTAIDSVLRQCHAPPFELIVVDNRSTDGTRAVVERYRDHAAVRYVFAGTLGLSHARNEGWREARGRIVVYLDDDAIAAEDWLAQVVRAFDFLPVAGMVGGRVDPIWERPRPPWVSDRLARFLSVLDWSPQPLVLHDPATRWLAGANMAIPRALLERVDGFSTALGRRGGNLMSGEETDLQYRLLQQGHPSLYFPAMTVRHLIPGSRLTRAWFLRRFFWQGVSDARMTVTGPPAEAAPPSSRLRRLTRAPRRLATALWPTADPARFTEQCLAWVQLGRLAAAFVARPQLR